MVLEKNRSTQDAGLDLKNIIFKSLNEGKYTGAVYIDYKKAFDTISHTKLLSKMPRYGFNVSVIDWFECYLSD